MEAGLVSSAAYEIQLTADCELLHLLRSSWSFYRGKCFGPSPDGG
jgi:hypothetical protein